MAKYCPDKNDEALYTECLECKNKICEKDMFYCLIAGSRNYDDYAEFTRIVNVALKNKPKQNIMLVSGHCECGADMFAERYAKEYGIAIKLFPANWKKDGRSAGYIRNKAMHEYITKSSLDEKHRGVILFWDGLSRGTAQSIPLAKKYNNPLRIWNYKQKTLRVL